MGIGVSEVLSYCNRMKISVLNISMILFVFMTDRASHTVICKRSVSPPFVSYHCFCRLFRKRNGITRLTCQQDVNLKHKHSRCLQ